MIQKHNMKKLSHFSSCCSAPSPCCPPHRPTLCRFWITFKEPPQFSPLNLGCGVTAYDYADALTILESKVFVEKPVLEIDLVIEDIDIEALDKSHVIPNIGLVTSRGVWFPLGY